jgi:predicted ATPase/Tfp pilus assembly protein PilF
MTMRSRLQFLRAELRRRKVVRVVAAYAVAGWVIVQVVETTWEALGLPPGTLTVVIVVVLAGLPLAVVLSWAYELVPDSTAERMERQPAGAAGDRSAQGGAGLGPPPPASPTLPTPTTPFVGRQAELQQLNRLLREPDSRLITVTGPGGVGKTRFALEAPRAAAAAFPHGMVFVPLGGLSDPDLLVPALAEALGIRLSRRDDPLTEVLDFLRNKRLLLVLDNFEHLIDGARPLSELLEHAAELRLLVTSRERLGLVSETLLPLEGLTLAPDTDGREADAVHLFAVAARRVDPRFGLDVETRPCVARICELLDGVPLALELAATWVRTLSCQEIVEELQRGLDILSSTAPDLPARHHSLRATFASSWQLLSEQERHAVARLSVFRSAFDRDAAAEVARADTGILRQLVDKSLLSRAGGGFIMLDVIRQYAAERLNQRQREADVARTRHARHFFGLLQSVEPGVIRSDPAALAEVASRIDEVRAAWASALERGDAAALLGAVNTLFHFYEARGWAREGADVFGRSALRLARGAGSDSGGDPDLRLLLARLDLCHGVCRDRLGEAAEAETLLLRGLARAREADAAGDVVFALLKLGANRRGAGRYEEAEAVLREARELADRDGDRFQGGWALAYLGNVAWARGDYQNATRLYHEALAILRREEDRNGTWMTLNNLGVIAGDEERYDEAARRFREALAIQVELGNRRSAALLHHNLGAAAVELGDRTAARQHLESAIAISEEMGYRPVLAFSLTTLARLHLADGEIGRADRLLRRALETAAAAGNQPYVLGALLLVAHVRRAAGDRAGATELAELVVRHPASEQERRDAAAILLEELHGAAGVAAGGQHADEEDLHRQLDRTVAEVLADEPLDVPV